MDKIDQWIEDLRRLGNEIISEGEKTRDPTISFILSDISLGLGCILDSLDHLKEKVDK